MKQETSAKLKYGAWGLVRGAAAATIVGFAWGGWVTGGTAKGKTDEAVLASRAAICVAQFMRGPEPRSGAQSVRMRPSRGSAAISLEKGAGTRCPGRERQVLPWLKLAPRGLTFLPQNEPAAHGAVK